MIFIDIDYLRDLKAGFVHIEEDNYMKDTIFRFGVGESILILLNCDK